MRICIETLIHLSLSLSDRLLPILLKRLLDMSLLVLSFSARNGERLATLTVESASVSQTATTPDVFQSRSPLRLFLLGLWPVAKMSSNILFEHV